jgi:hypothetical protein
MGIAKGGHVLRAYPAASILRRSDKPTGDGRRASPACDRFSQKVVTHGKRQQTTVIETVPDL